MSQDIRWQQRFSNYQKALLPLKDGVELSETRELSLLEKQGLIQAFEYTHELAWKTLKDFLEYRGSTEKIYGSKDATRQAFSYNIISNGGIWMNMIQDRNLTSHTYDETRVEVIVENIIHSYFINFDELEKTFMKLKNDD